MHRDLYEVVAQSGLVKEWRVGHGTIVFFVKNVLKRPSEKLQLTKLEMGLDL